VRQGNNRRLTKGLERESKTIHGMTTAQKILFGQLCCRLEFSQKKVEKITVFFLTKLIA